MEINNDRKKRIINQAIVITVYLWCLLVALSTVVMIDIMPELKYDFGEPTDVSTFLLVLSRYFLLMLGVMVLIKVGLINNFAKLYKTIIIGFAFWSVVYMAYMVPKVAIPGIILSLLVQRWWNIIKSWAMLTWISMAIGAFSYVLHPFWVVIFFLIVAVEDWFLVFKSKFMKSLVDSEFKDLGTLPLYGGGVLGFGDIMFPLITIVSFRIYLPTTLLFIATVIAATGIIELMLRMERIKKKTKKPVMMPALPPMFISTMSGIYIAALIKWTGLLSL